MQSSKKKKETNHHAKLDLLHCVFFKANSCAV